MFLKFLGNREFNVTLPEFMVSKFKTKIKVARKSHIKEAALAVLSFKKTLVKSTKKPPHKLKASYKSMNLYFEDETRFGRFTKAGKSLTAKGVQPICTFQQVFQSLYVFGAFSPLSGDRFLLTLPHCNADNFHITW